CLRLHELLGLRPQLGLLRAQRQLALVELLRLRVDQVLAGGTHRLDLLLAPVELGQLRVELGPRLGERTLTAGNLLLPLTERSLARRKLLLALGEPLLELRGLGLGLVACRRRRALRACQLLLALG